MVLARVERGEHAVNERAVELDVDEAIDSAMLQHLEAADGLAELLAQLDVLERDGERRGGKPDELGRGPQHQQLLQLGDELLCAGASRDHLLRHNMNVGEVEL